MKATEYQIVNWNNGNGHYVHFSANEFYGPYGTAKKAFEVAETLKTVS